LQMYNLRARYYNPSSGRFNARDNFAGINFDPQSLHKYQYCNANPVDELDPSGNETLVELMVSMFIQVLLRAKDFRKWILKRVIEKKIQIIFGGVSGFAFGYASGLAAEMGGAHANPAVFGLVGAIGGMLAGLLSPLKWKASASLGFAIGMISSVAND